MTTESEECKRRVKAIELGIKPSRVDMRAGLISALAGESGDMLQAAGEGALMPVRCGIHPHHLKNAYTALCDAVEQLMKKRKKHLL
jgi:hypothetical protein